MGKNISSSIKQKNGLNCNIFMEDFLSIISLFLVRNNR